MRESVSENLWLIAGFLVAVGCSVYLVRQFAWPKIQCLKGLAVLIVVAGFLLLFVFSLLPAAYMAGVSFALLERVGWPMQVGFYVVSLTAGVITSSLTLLLALIVVKSATLFARRATVSGE
jgi:hypothetical protein